MDEAERAFRDALHRVDTMPIPVPGLDPADLRTSSPKSGRPGRWLAAAAAVVLVAGLGIWGLTGRGGAVPAIPAASATAGNPLLGTTWMLMELDGMAAKRAPDKVPFLEFSTSSTFLSGDPCNRGDGTYTLDGDNLRLFPGPRTEIGCNSGQQELFWRALEDTRRAARTADLLELRDAGGRVLATFRSSTAFTQPTTGGSALPIPTAPSTSPDDPISSLLPSPTPAAGVAIRLGNSSDLDFEHVIAVFPDGRRVGYGDIPAGSRSDYADVGQAYRYTYLELTAAGKVYTYRPIDYVGESPLEPGHYTYLLDLVDGSIELQFGID